MTATKEDNFSLKSNFLASFWQRVTWHPDRIAFRFLEHGEEETASVTYGELDKRARTVAAYLQRQCVPGDRVVLVFLSGIDFAASLLGCFYAGLIAVPTYPPRPNRGSGRLFHLIKDSCPRAILTTTEVFETLRFSLNGREVDCEMIAVENLPDFWASEWREVPVDPDSLAMLQYTSGSTGTPKGVMVSHGNIAANLRMIRDALGFTESDVQVSWLPVFHDLGLVGAILEPLFVGATVILMPPTAFLERPVRWLMAITKYRATISGGPNFAFDLCVRKIRDFQKLGLDLTSLRLLVNAAEPVRQETMLKFAHAFASSGFVLNRFLVSYGLAESTLLVSCGNLGLTPKECLIDKAAMENNQVALQSHRSSRTMSVPSCGRIAVQEELVVVDPETGSKTNALEIGEIWLRGTNIAKGYWNRSEDTQKAFQCKLREASQGVYFRTGDLGFVHEGELYLVGRLKDLIIINGRNLVPHDIEHVVEQCHPAIRPGFCAAFSAEGEASEKIAIACELKDITEAKDFLKISEAILEAIAREYEVGIAIISFLAHGEIRKTSSGKIQRRATQKALMSGKIVVVFRWIQGEPILNFGQPRNDADALVDSRDSMGEIAPKRIQEAAKFALERDISLKSIASFAGIVSHDISPREELLHNVVPFHTQPKTIPNNSEPEYCEIPSSTFAFLATWLEVNHNIPEEHVSRHRPLTSYGLDSLSVIELSGAIQDQFGVSIPPSRFWECRSLGDLEQQIVADGRLRKKAG